MTIEFWWRQIFEILMIHKPSLWSRDVTQKIWARSVQPFWRLLDTNRQTNKQTDKPNLYIDDWISGNKQDQNEKCVNCKPCCKQLKERIKRSFLCYSEAHKTVKKGDFQINIITFKGRDRLYKVVQMSIHPQILKTYLPQIRSFEPLICAQSQDL